MNITSRFCVWLAASAAVAAQTPTAFRSRVDTVAVYATVRGADGKFVADLTASDFELFDNGKQQTISLFSADTQPTTVAILLDRSGSQSNQMSAVDRAARAFVADLLPADRASVGSLNFDCQDMTADKGALMRVLDSPMQMDLWSPIWAASDRVMWALSREPGRRAILLFSDGDDSGAGAESTLKLSKMAGSCRPSARNVDVTLDELSHHATADGVLFYTVTVENGTRINKSDLEALARRSGARSFNLTSDTDLTPAFKNIVDELHHQYLLGFVPAVFDDRVHTLEVRVNRPGAAVRARQNYVATQSADGGGSAGLRARSQPDTPQPPSEPDVALAIKRGAEGAKLQAACTTSVSEGAGGRTEVIRVVAEGPIGRIMRASREAKARNATFAPAGVTPEMRSTALTVTIDGSRFPETVMLRDQAPHPRTLLPLSMSLYQRRPPGASIRTATFDMAEFNRLVGPTIEVLITFSVNSLHAQCRLTEADVLAIR